MSTELRWALGSAARLRRRRAVGSEARELPGPRLGRRCGRLVRDLCGTSCAATAWMLQNYLHPTGAAPPPTYRLLAGREGPFVASSDFDRMLPDSDPSVGPGRLPRTRCGWLGF